MNNNIKINGKILPRYKEIISDEALNFIKEIHDNFNSKRLELLKEPYPASTGIVCHSLLRPEFLIEIDPFAKSF